MNKNKNYAPKYMEGEYNIHIEGNKVTLNSSVWNRPFKSVTVKCHPDDTFDIGEAMRIAMERLDDEIRVGDTVKIVDNGASYCIKTEWPSHLSKYACKYRYGVIPKEGTKCKVIVEFPSNFSHCYLVQPVSNEYYLGDKKYSGLICRGIYIMDEKGLEKV